MDIFKANGEVFGGFERAVKKALGARVIDVCSGKQDGNNVRRMLRRNGVDVETVDYMLIQGKRTGKNAHRYYLVKR